MRYDRVSDNRVSDKIFSIANCVMCPTMVVTQAHPKKWVRLLGAFGILPLCPLIFIGAPVMFVAIVAYAIEET